MRGKQQTIQFHVNDFHHVNPTANDELLTWMNNPYGQHGEVTATHGEKHDYLGMIFEFINGEVEVNMIDYSKSMVAEFTVKFRKDVNQ